MPEDQPLFEKLASLAETFVSGFDVTDLFQRLVDSCLELADADEAGLLLVDIEGRLGIAATTGSSVLLVELLQLQAKEGPCLDAFRTGKPVRTGPLDGEPAQGAWPVFAKQATAAGFDSVVAVPMRLRSEVIGTLNLFRSSPGDATDRDVMAAQTLADLATIAILQDRVVDDAREIIDQLQSALDTRVLIEQAKGIISERTKLDVTAAFDRIRAHARSTNRRISDVAAEIVSGDLAPGLFEETP
ncbi:MAG: GAF and ANTAR domain-containing protein [Acidimicrobiia bacterium]